MVPAQCGRVEKRGEAGFGRTPCRNGIYSGAVRSAYRCAFAFRRRRAAHITSSARGPRTAPPPPFVPTSVTEQPPPPQPPPTPAVVFEGSLGKASAESRTPSPSESRNPVPVNGTAAFGVSGSFELTVTVAPKGPPSACGANVTSIVQLSAGAIVGVELPHGFDPPERSRE